MTADEATPDFYRGQKRRRSLIAIVEQGESAKEYSRENVKQTDDRSPSDRVSTSTSRPQGKKLLFALLHSERNTEEPTNDAGGQKLDAELVSREHHSVDVESLLAELQLKNKELERMHTDAAERDITISKLRADLVARETTLREMQASASNCRLLLEALETGFTTCQNMFSRMQTKAKDLAREVEELRTRNKDTFRQRLDKPEEHDLFGIRNPNSSVRSSHLLLRNAHR